MKQLSEMSVEELNQLQKSTKLLTGVMIGLFIGMVAVNVFLTSQKEFSMLTIFPIFLLPLVIMNFKKLRKIKEELLLR